MPDQPAIPPVEKQSSADKILQFVVVIILTAVPFFGLLMVAYGWRVSLSVSFVLAIFYDIFREIKMKL